MKKIISIITKKGGVGKTTTTFNLACALAKKKKKVLVVDMDSQHNLSMTCGLMDTGSHTIMDLIYKKLYDDKVDYNEYVYHNEENKIDVIPSNIFLDSVANFVTNYKETKNKQGPLSDILNDEFFDKYDYVLYDSKTAIDVITKAQIDSSDYAIVIVEPGLYSFVSVDEITPRLTENNHTKLMGILINKASGSTVVSQEVSENFRQSYPDLVFNTVIPNRPAQTENVIATGLGCVNLKGNTLSDSYMALAAEVIKRSKK